MIVFLGRKVMRMIATTLGLCVMTIACHAKDNNWQVFVSTFFGYELRYPPTCQLWGMSKYPAPGASFHINFFDPFESTGTITIPPRIYVSVYDEGDDDESLQDKPKNSGSWTFDNMAERWATRSICSSESIQRCVRLQSTREDNQDLKILKFDYEVEIAEDTEEGPPSIHIFQDTIYAADISSYKDKRILVIHNELAPEEAVQKIVKSLRKLPD